MRPAWLPPQPTGSAESPRHVAVRPRSAVSRPQSPVSNSPPRDAMVLSARQLLHEQTQSPMFDGTSTATSVSLRDFMDSFPLVPLAIIPRLGLADLLECEVGLLALYQSLAIDTNSEDAQLGKYITRQLGLVQRQIEQARARERVLKLLLGEEPALLHTEIKSASPKPLPVFLQPSTPSSASTQPTHPALASAKSTTSLQLKRSDTTSQLSKAKAIAKATVTTAFVITTRENSLNARQTRAKKKTKQQLDEEKARRQEREKEKRRQAAYQRLVARQALQAKKKADAQHRKKQSGHPIPPPETPRGSFVAVTDHAQNVTKSNTDVERSSSSDESDVSNCSDNDEADEKAILEMPVNLKLEEQGPDELEVEESGELEDGTEEDEPDDAEEIDMRIEGDQEHATTTERSSLKLATPADASEVNHKDGNQESESHPDEEPELAADDNVTSTDCVVASGMETEEHQEQRAREAIALQLERFVAERTESALEQLRCHHLDQKRATARLQRQERLESRPTTASSAGAPARQANGCEEPLTLVSGPPSSPCTANTPTSPTKKRPLPPTAKRLRPAASSTSLLIPRPLDRDIQDYRSYFPNFFCILTSVYEQRMAFSGGSTNATSTSSSSLNANLSATAGHAGDQALRLQLKLYQSWQTIMSDYATVFGASIPTPDGFSSISASNSPYTAHYRINSQTRKEVSDIVITALEKLGDWEEHPSGLGLKTTWNLLWTWSKPNVERKTLLAWQKVNHFQHAKAITRKDCLKKNIGKYQAMGGRLKQAYDIVPASFLLPQEYVVFVQAFQERAKTVPSGKNIWIMKPVALSRGRGISLVNDLSDVVYGEQVVIQEYIANPLLLDGFKFDLRLYVLVTSFNPLEAFFYEEGFVRMCTRAYEDGDLTNLFIHLTNSSIQKENQDAIAANPENPINSAQHDAEAGGTKMTLAYLWKRLEAMGADVSTVKNDILTVILKALMCGEDHIPFQVNSFDLYGYDILLDTNFRPWLIEINSSPSMARENDLDYQVKDALIFDTLKLVNPLHFDRTKLVDVVSRRFHDAEVDKKRSHANTRHPKEAEALAARQLNEDLTDILRGHVPRSYGEMPEHLGSYTRIAPHTTIHNQLMKLKKSCLRLDRR